MAGSVVVSKARLHEWVVEHEKLSAKSAKNYKSTLNMFVPDDVDVLERLKDGNKIRQMLEDVENASSRSSHASRLAGYVRSMAKEGIEFDVSFKDKAGNDRSLGSQMYYETGKSFWLAVAITKHNLKRLDVHGEMPEYVDAETQTDDSGYEHVDASQPEPLSLRLECSETLGSDDDPDIIPDSQPDDCVTPRKHFRDEDVDLELPPMPKKIRTKLASNILQLLKDASQIMKESVMNDLDDPARLDMPLSERKKLLDAKKK